jgi:hypothetical protein
MYLRINHKKAKICKPIIRNISPRARLTKEAEYPDQKPWMPFSDRIVDAMSETDSSVDFAPVRADIIAAVCFLVTILAIGVVKNLEQAPASAPTPNSSSTGRYFDFPPFL